MASGKINHARLELDCTMIARILVLDFFFIKFYLFTRSRLQSHEGEFWSILVVGLPALSRPVVSALLHKQCTKRNRRFTDEGRGKTKETKERRRTDEVGGLEIYGSAESVKNGHHSVVGNDNYWVTFVAQSQFVLIRCLWTLILKAWRPLRVGASSSIDDGSAFQVLTYQWGNDRAIVAFDRTGRSREGQNEWLSESWCLVLGLSTGVRHLGRKQRLECG